MCNIIYVDHTGSTNSLLASASRQLDHGTVIAAMTQTAGRGQRGNSWEAEPRKNLTFSLLLKPRVMMASRQFELSQLVSISILKVLKECLSTDEVRIKWPNDIYYRDRKLCGILIENTLEGARIEQSIVGVGINVNQTEFVSDAPNPISLANITGHTFDLDKLLEAVATRITSDFDVYEADPKPEILAARYRYQLWRNDGYWPYLDRLTGERFEGRIAAVAPTGHITLSTHDGKFHTYAFKEVAFVLQGVTL